MHFEPVFVEADVLAQMDPQKLGINITGKVPCAASTGLPAGSMFDSTIAARMDPVTTLARHIEPSMVLKTEAQTEAEAEEQMAAADSTIQTMLSAAIALSAVFFVVNAASAILCCRKHHRLANQVNKTGEV